MGCYSCFPVMASVFAISRLLRVVAYGEADRPEGNSLGHGQGSHVEWHERVGLGVYLILRRCGRDIRGINDTEYLDLEFIITQTLISLTNTRTMPSFVTAVGAAALLLPGAVLGAVAPKFPGISYHALAPNFGCNIVGVAEYFAREYPAPPQCQDYYSAQVHDLCCEHLKMVKTVYTTTVTPVLTQTATLTEEATMATPDAL